MKKVLFFLLAFALTVCGATAELSWLTSVPEAQAQAKKENKLTLLNFTGSDWCVACKRLDDGVLSKPEFQNYARKNLVLVMLDFPLKDEPAALRAANEALQEKYKVDGYPTLIALNPGGKVVWSETGYQGEAPSEIIAQLEKARK